ncbi:hypothetical protein SK128_016262 [Halocaridina rubra]|uniref:Uncharacterized protein n=1 Tax=Halocaridina rubra TaxID=373956 RepID=A0AAN9A3X6_HALRR
MGVSSLKPLVVSRGTFCRLQGDNTPQKIAKNDDDFNNKKIVVGKLKILLFVRIPALSKQNFKRMMMRFPNATDIRRGYGSTQYIFLHASSPI